MTTARQCLAVRCIFNFFTHPAYIIDDNMAGNFWQVFLLYREVVVSRYVLT